MNARMVVDNTISSKEKETPMTSQGTGFDTLSQARNLVGGVQVSVTSIQIQPTLLKIDHRNEALMATMGLACIMSAFEEASWVFTNTGNYFGRHKAEPMIKAGSEALAFIQGTGLEIAIHAYGLDYDANQLRYTFFRTFHVKN